MASKYWVANNPNSEITDAKAMSLKMLSATAGAYIPILGPVTVMPASGNLLVKNTYYAENTTDAETFLLPTVANSTAGDWTGVNILATSSTEARDISVTGDNSVIMAGLTNGAGGAGSWVGFVFNGTAWTATGLSRNIGDGTALTVGTAAMRFAETA